ncbi:cytochrome P450 1A1-like [Acanthaster planci]|uniref:unspecific monooxygenase n=1 Tax=Acanthaster planci TaxID=133434 RepID=A0A8B7XHI9_ACAPL|nr:cytochrome P450 1A1-like [Acanthaster planci]
MSNSGKTLPGPRGLPILGNILDLGETLHVSLYQLAQKYGDVYQIRIGSRPVVVLNGIETIKQALVKQSTDFAGRPDFISSQVMKEINGASMTFSDYSPAWKLHRKIAETALRHFTSGQQSKSVQDKVLFEVQELISTWTNNNSGSTVVDPSIVLKLSVSNIMCSYIFSRRHKLDDPRLTEFSAMSDDFGAAASSGNTMDFMPWLKYLPTKTMQNFRRLLLNFKDWFGGYINQHREAYQEDSEKDILDYLITVGNKIDEEELEQLNLTREMLQTTVYDLFGAGFDTVSAVLTWAILLVILHPEIQRDIQEEIDTVIGKDMLPQLTDRGKLPLTEACLYEVLRFSSVVPFTIPHSTTRETQLNGYLIPKGTVIFVNLYSINQDPKIWTGPQEFNPRRFLTGDGRLDPEKTASILPFGAGRRRCLGSELGRIEMFLYFTTLMQKCRLEIPNGERPSTSCIPGLAQRPLPYQMRIKLREKGPSN